MRQWFPWFFAVAAMARLQPATPAAEPFEATGRVLTGGRIFAIAAADGDLELLANRGSRQTGRTERLLFENAKPSRGRDRAIYTPLHLNRAVLSRES